MKNFNELSVTSSYKESNLQLVEQKACIVVGIANPRIKIRVEVLLSESPEYQTIYISSGSETRKLIEEADLIIGSGGAPETGDCSRRLRTGGTGYP